MGSTQLKNVVVTGGLGFIGSHLVERLIETGSHVVVLDNLSNGRRSNLKAIESHPSLKIHECDLSHAPKEWEHLINAGDAIFHLAALADIVPSIQKPLNYYSSNVTGTAHILEVARQKKASRFVYAASSSCYGMADQVPTPETAPIRPEYPYALTKTVAEQLVLHWGQVYKLPVVSLRFFNVYGPRVRTTGTYGAVLGVFLAQKLSKSPLTIVGDGKQTRDFTFVTDVVEALMAAAVSHSTGEIFNVGSGATVAINKLADLIGGEKTYLPKRPGEPDCTFADISKIKKTLGWSPKVSIEEGVQRMLSRIEDWREAPVWTPSKIAEATEDWFRFLSPSSHETHL